MRHSRSASVTLKQIRAAGMKSGALSSQWLPEVLVVLDAIPKGPTGKPMRIGLAEKLELPELASAGASSALTGALRRSLRVRRARAPPPLVARASSMLTPPPPPPEPLLDACGYVRRAVRHYLALVLHSIYAVSGNVLDADDDLAESAGLSSLTVARMRVSLEAKLGVALPPALLLRAATARALAASLLRHVRANATESGGGGGEGGDDHGDETERKRG